MNIQEGYDAKRFVGPTNKTIDYWEVITKAIRL